MLKPASIECCTWIGGCSDRLRSAYKVRGQIRLLHCEIVEGAGAAGADRETLALCGFVWEVHVMSRAF